MKGNKKFGCLNSLMKSKYVSRECKLMIYKTVIRPTVTYTCETWIKNKAKEKVLERGERKILRCIFSGKKTENKWKRKAAETWCLYYEPSTTTVSKTLKIR